MTRVRACSRHIDGRVGRRNACVVFGIPRIVLVGANRGSERLRASLRSFTVSMS